MNEKIIELGQYYEKHRGFYGMAFQKTIELEACSAAMKKLSVRWAEARSSQQTVDNQTESENRNKASLEQFNDTMFVRENELAELTGLTEGLKSLSGSFETMHFCLNHVEEASWNAFPLTTKDAAMNHLLLDWYILLDTEEQAIWALTSAAKSLRNAVKLLKILLENTDSSMMIVEGGFEGPRFIPRLLLVASEIVNKGAISARVGTNLIHDNENRWRDIRTKQFLAQ